MVSGGAMSAKKIYPTPSYPCHQPKPLIQARRDSFFHIVDVKYWPHHPNDTAEFETYHTSNVFPVFLCPIFVRLWELQPVSCPQLAGRAPGVVFCFFRPSASNFREMIQRCSSAYLGCNKRLFELLLLFNRYFMLFRPFSVCPIYCRQQ